MTQCVSAMRAPLTWQRSATYAGMVTTCMHSCQVLLLLHTNLSNSAARTASFDTAHTTEYSHVIRPYLIPVTCAASHSGHRLNGFDSYSVLAITSHLCICIRVAVQRRTVAAATPYPCVWLLGVACAARLWRLYCTEALREERWEHKAKVRQSADSIQVLCGSCNGESRGLSLLAVACVNHELHAWKIRGPR